MSVVVDTNVIRVADELAPQAGPDCAVKCAETLEEAARGVVSIDSGRRIILEYLGQVRKHYPYEPGTAFVRQLQQHEWNPAHCERVDIHEHPDRGFEEFPDDADPELVRFDRSDRKFVAVAIASRLHPPILNAADSDWLSVRDALAQHGVHVEFLCPELV
jgi:hypothetical protein